MPVYRCSVPIGVIADEHRQPLATAITDIHVEVTGAPRHFVSVVFEERPTGVTFTGGRPAEPTIISGFVRAGREREARGALLSRISAAWCEITGQRPDQLVLGLIELDPTSTMEAGLIMPAPGEEAAWVEEHREALGALLA
ncbi:MAG: tautomerase family protein [Baekduiaceae bacterium]